MAMASGWVGVSTQPRCIDAIFRQEPVLPTLTTCPPQRKGNQAMIYLDLVLNLSLLIALTMASGFVEREARELKMVDLKARIVKLERQE